MKINISKKVTKELADVPDGDLFLIGDEMYVKIVPNLLKTENPYINNTINAVSIRTGKATLIGSKTRVRCVKSISVVVEE